MSVADRRRLDVESSMNKLSISASKPASKAKKPSQPAPDSWEDEAAELSSEASDGDDSGPVTPTAQTSALNAPPPTPSSPSAGFHTAFENPYEVPTSAASGSRVNRDKRPEKQTAVASRLIAGALGVRTPKKTEEMREYEKAVREKEKRRIEGEKEERKKEEERRRAERESAWED